MVKEINTQQPLSTHSEYKEKKTMKGKCERYKRIEDGSLQEKLWKIYVAELGPEIAAETAFPQQCFKDFEMFVEIMLDLDFEKFVLSSGDGRIIGLAVSSSNLEKVRDVAGVRFNPEIYEAIFPDLYKRGGIHYFPAMCISKEDQDEGHIYALGNGMISMVNENDGVAAFDHSERKNPGMGGLITHIAKELGLRPEAKTTVVDQQTFVVVG